MHECILLGSLAPRGEAWEAIKRKDTCVSVTCLVLSPRSTSESPPWTRSWSSPSSRTRRESSFSTRWASVNLRENSCLEKMYEVRARGAMDNASDYSSEKNVYISITCLLSEFLGSLPPSFVEETLLPLPGGPHWELPGHPSFTAPRRSSGDTEVFGSTEPYPELRLPSAPGVFVVTLAVSCHLACGLGAVGVIDCPRAPGDPSGPQGQGSPSPQPSD